MWLLFFVFLILTVCAATYQKKTPVVMAGQKTTTVKPGVIIGLGILTFLFLLGALGSPEGQNSNEAKPVGSTPVQSHEEFFRALQEQK
jgi:hypothetical protein